MNSHQWERAHKIAQEIHAADLAWTAALDAKIAALKVNNHDDVRVAEDVIIRASFTMAQRGVALATIMLELGPSPIPSIKAPFQIPQPDQAPNLIVDEATPTSVLGEGFYSEYAEWFFESGEFPALPGDKAVAS